MGNIFRRQKGPVEELDQILAKIQALESRCYHLRQNRYNMMWWLTVAVLFGSSVYSAMICMDVEEQRSRYLKIGIIWLVAIFIFVCFRFAAGRSFDFLLRRGQKNIELLNARRSEIIENVKENEKFKVAKEIIEKYGSAEDLAAIGIQQDNNESRISPPRTTPPKDVPRKMDTGMRPAGQVSTVPEPPNKDMSIAPHSTPLTMMNSTRLHPMNAAFRTPLHRQPVRPFVQASRTPIDKIIDYIIGDGPSNRFALICKQCCAHNGMALREEFESMAFVCFNCGFYNPAKNAKPLRTPRRTDLPSITLPHTKPFIRTASNSETSEEDEDDKVNDERNNQKTPVPTIESAENSD